MASSVPTAALSSSKDRQHSGTAVAETDDGKTSPLSRNEEIHALKAVYQYQPHHNLFGRNEARYDQTYVSHDLAVRFYDKFEPWEVEAIRCIHVFDEVKGELVTLRQHFAMLAPTSFGPFDPDGPSPFAFMSTQCPFFIMTLLLTQRACMALQIKVETILTGANKQIGLVDEDIARGLETAVRLLQLRDPAERSIAVQQEKAYLDRNSHIRYESLRSDLSIAAQKLRRGARRGLGPWDEAEARRDPLAFLGDSVPTEGGPPVAWVRLWNGKYANLYGGYVPPSLGGDGATACGTSAGGGTGGALEAGGGAVGNRAGARAEYPGPLSLEPHGGGLGRSRSREVAVEAPVYLPARYYVRLSGFR
ncbi:uncharacterized protein PG986_013028 [Apiospora aurea]|uniref:Uncharacterized protein n=1 Tax=Apiospora aurea TaxID=335848 RepID=A0ABR1Q1P5_9PEZI